MSNLYPCALCGICRYRHDVTRAPKMSNLFRINEWSLAIGDSAMHRILESTKTKNPAYLCVEHFELSTQFDRSGNLKQLAKPLMVSEEERKLYDNYFLEHGCFKLTKPAFYERKFTFQNISCSLCSKQVKGNEMSSHAESHAPLYLNLSEHLCAEHTKNRPPSDELIRLKCEECSSLQTRAAFEISKFEAERCFPMFEFRILEIHERNKHIFELDPEIRPEYAKLRPHYENWKPRTTRLRSSTMKKAVKEEVKEEIQDPDYDYEEDVNNNEVELKMDIDEDEKEDDEEDEDEDEDGPAKKKSKRPYYTVTHPQMTLQEHFQQDPHPSFEKMLQMTMEGKNPCQFNTIFRFFRTKRELDRVECAPNDTCQRAERYLKMESEPSARVRETPEEKMKMLEQFEDHVIRGQKFTIAHSYVMAEKLGLPPKYLRAQFRSYKLRRTCHESRMATIREFEKKHKAGVQAANLNTTHVALRVATSNVAPKRLPPEIRQVLEEAYQQKVKAHGDGDWPRDSFKALAVKTGMTSEKVAKWMSCRKFRGIGNTLPERRHQFTPEERRHLKSIYMENPYPTPEEYRQMAARLKLSLSTVIRYFDTQRTASRKQAELKALEGDFAGISEEKCEILAKTADENRSILANERVELADSLGLSYQLVTHWIELYRKGLIDNRRRIWRRRAERVDEFDDPEDDVQDDSEDVET